MEGSRKVRALAGWALVGLGTLLWIAVPVVLALSIDGGLKATLIGGLLVLAEVAFWAGAVLLGIGLFARLKGAYVRRSDRRGRATGRGQAASGDETAGRDEAFGRDETPGREANKEGSWT